MILTTVQATDNPGRQSFRGLFLVVHHIPVFYGYGKFLLRLIGFAMYDSIWLYVLEYLNFRNNER